MLLSACGGSSTLAPRIEWLLFVFCGPKTGARFWTQKWGHNTKISSPASKFVALVSGPWYMRFAFFKNALSCDRLHLFHSCFLALGARMLVSQDIYYIYIILFIYIYIYISEPSLVYLPVGIFATKDMFRTWCLYPNYFFTTYIWQNLARHGRFAHTAIYKLYCLIWLSCIKVDQTEWPWCWTQWYVYFLFPSAFYNWNWVLDGCGGKLCVWSSDPSAIRCRGFKWGYESGWFKT